MTSTQKYRQLHGWSQKKVVYHSNVQEGKNYLSDVLQAQVVHKKAQWRVF